MADPLSLAAIAGLIYAARKCSSKDDKVQVVGTSENYQQETSQENVFNNSFDQRSTIMNTMTGSIADDPGVSGHGVRNIDQGKQGQPSFGDIAFMKHPNGEPVHDFRNRPYVSGKMNNFGPVEKQLVGSGLGVGPDVPAYGGYQQVFRVLPNNVNGYKLTTLPGRSGPAGDVSGGKQTLSSQLNHKAPEKTAFLPSRRPNVAGRAQGQGGALTGVVVRGKYEKTKRTTNRSETTLRQDGLEFNPAKSVISAQPLAQDPTRNKGDLNDTQFYFNNQAAPGITNFEGGYTIAPGSELLSQKPKDGAAYSPQQLEQYGFRPDTRRGNKDRAGVAGGMNVRADPLNAGGAVTAVRSDCNRIDGRLGPANGAWSQNYVQDEYYQLNPYKGNSNPLATTRELNVAKNQLMNNPLAHTLA